MKTTFTLADFQKWGRKGGQKSRRTWTPEQKKAMVAKRRANKLKK